MERKGREEVGRKGGERRKGEGRRKREEWRKEGKKERSR